MRAAGKLAITATLVALLVSPAAAESPADAAFRQGRELFKAGRYADACAQFEKSQSLDPQIGTLFNLAQCHEKIGKLVSALAAYREVMTNDANGERRAFAGDLEKKLAARIPKLVVQINGNPPGLVVLLGDRAIRANQAVELDHGEHTLTVQANGMQTVTTTVRVNEDRRTTTVLVPLTPAGSGEAAKPTQTSEPTDSAPRSRRKLYGIATLAVGGVTLGTGAVFGALAISSWNDAKAICGGATCASDMDADRANSLRDKALNRATVSNVLFVAGGLIAAAGVVLWVTAPTEREVAVSAFAGGDGGGVTFSGSF